MNPQTIVCHIKKYIQDKGYCFEEGSVENMYLGLKSCPFILLFGPDCCGKYAFASLFCEAIGAGNESGRFIDISVGAAGYSKDDFSDDTAKFVSKAINDRENPYFIYLHNMNMSNPDSYLSSFYTSLDIKSHPENLYVIGGFDSDGDYSDLSLKIINRANIIPVNPIQGKSEKPKENTKIMEIQNEFFKQKYFESFDVTDKKLTNQVFSFADEINKSLCYINREIPFRCINSILFYLMLNKEFKLLDESEAFDNIILQKVLVRLEGNNAYIKTILGILFKLCVPKGVGDYYTSSLKMFRAITYPDCRYPKSAKQIALMTKRYEDNGYLS